jgi:RNA polymerase sigma factor (sigma-70 family)
VQKVNRSKTTAAFAAERLYNERKADMKGATSNHSNNAHFRTTHWSVVLAARVASSPDYGDALTTLCETYWFPIYAYMRRQGYAGHEAEDHTQGFFATLMEKQGLRSVNPEKGKFRSYLLGALKHYLADVRDRDQAQKRGGGFKVISLNIKNCENQLNLESKNGLSPEQQYDRSWALTILQRAINRLEVESRSTCKSQVFEFIIHYLIPSEEHVPYRVLAAQLNMSEAAIKAAIYRLRKRYRELLKDEIAHTVSTEKQVDEEIQDLFTALSR